MHVRKIFDSPYFIFLQVPMDCEFKGLHDPTDGYIMDGVVIVLCIIASVVTCICLYKKRTQRDKQSIYLPD